LKSWLGKATLPFINSAVTVAVMRLGKYSGTEFLATVIANIVFLWNVP
jgi:hypothetical protein